MIWWFAHGCNNVVVVLCRSLERRKVLDGQRRKTENVSGKLRIDPPLRHTASFAIHGCSQTMRKSVKTKNSVKTGQHVKLRVHHELKICVI